MTFIRTIINSDKLDNIVTIPDELKHQQVEILIFPVTEEKKETGIDFNPDSYSGILDLSENEIASELKAIRDEWERF